MNVNQQKNLQKIMLAFDKSSQSGRAEQLKTTCERPAPLQLGLEPGEVKKLG